MKENRHEEQVSISWQFPLGAFTYSSVLTMNAYLVSFVVQPYSSNSSIALVSEVNEGVYMAVYRSNADLVHYQKPLTTLEFISEQQLHYIGKKMGKKVLSLYQSHDLTLHLQELQMCNRASTSISECSLYCEHV